MQRLAALFAILCLSACSDADGEEQPGLVAEPGEELPGGATTNTLLFGSNAFTTPAANIASEHESSFYSGNSFFNQSWVEAPASTEARDGLGPLFNARSCAACHFKDGRGSPPLEPGDESPGLLFRLSGTESGEHGEPSADPLYGGQLQPLAIPGVSGEGSVSIEYRELPSTFADGEAYSLLEPSYALSGAAYGEFDPALRVSPRVAPAVIGLGLLEAIPRERLEDLADPGDADGDGISGEINLVPEVTSGEFVPGRFGWKAEQPSVLQQSAGAFNGDMGITSSLFPAQDCTPAESACAAATSGGEPEIADEFLHKVALYARVLAVPMREGAASQSILRGKELFHAAGCASCHVARHVTGAVDDLAELGEQVIWPYTDLLLHDMGEALSDQRPVFTADGGEWRTPPLWGLRFYLVVNGHERLLHDGRARGVAEAILWHGGEGEAAREFFRSLSSADRDLLVAFVESL